jgi:hypothetical protein
MAWRLKQKQEPGTALAGGFPASALLATAGYTCVEDLDGADVDELCDAGLSTALASKVLAELGGVS